MTTANRTTNHPATAAAELLRAIAGRIEAGETTAVLLIEQAADYSASVQAFGINDAYRLAGFALRLATEAAGPQA